MEGGKRFNDGERARIKKQFEEKANSQLDV